MRNRKLDKTVESCKNDAITLPRINVWIRWTHEYVSLVLLRYRIFVSRSVSVDIGASIPVSISIFVYVSRCGGRRMRNWALCVIRDCSRPTVYAR